MSKPFSTAITTPQKFLKPLALLLTFTLALAGCAGQFQTHSPTRDIEKSATDPRDYLAFQLDNQLNVLVISDPDADKAAAALSVAVGSGSDPKNREGLAHFLEHMLFLGTEKYPQADAYQRFISEHGGSHNAYTAFDETNYFFDINATDLQPALDRFAQFFIAPLFNEEYVEREKHAVHSEYQSKIRDDSRLQYDIFKTLSNPEHPFSQFSVGSLETLADQPGDPVRDDLLNFYRSHYSANLMTLVVLGKQSTAELQQLVTETFSDIANYNSARPEFKQPLFNQLPLQVNTQPNKNLRRLVFNFPIPPTREVYQTKPTYYLSSLLGHEGKGSLLSYLKQQGWADSLSAGINFESDQQASLQIAIGLTEAGLQQTDAIASALFHTIRLIREQGLEDWRYQEQAKLAALNFRFQQNSNNIHYVTRLASELHQVPAAKVLSAPYQMERFDRDLIRTYLDALRPDNLLLMRVGKGLATNQQTQHFNAPYAVKPIDKATQESWLKPTEIEPIQLPAPNPFVPENLVLLAGNSDSDKPRLSETGSDTRLWYRTDTSFDAPRADFYFTLRSAQVNRSARNVALTHLLVKTINDQLNEFSYPASLAGLGYQLYPHVRGVSVRISGYQDKQSVLLDEILKSLTAPQIEQDTFNRHKDELARQWENSLKQKPYQQSMQKISALLTEPDWSETALIAALAPLTTADLQAFSKSFLDRLDIEVLANGNIEPGTAQAMTKQLDNYLANRQKTQVQRPRIARLGKQKLLYPFHTSHSDHAATLYVQGNDKRIATRARFALLNQFLSAPFYHELRTRQQLGYIVFSSPLSLMDVPGLAFTVQSPSTPGEAIIEAIEQFIADFALTVENLDSAGLDKHKQALTGRILEKDAQLSQRSNRYWYEIDRRNFQFDTREQLVAAIEQISLADFKQAYREYLLDQPRLLASITTPNNNESPAVPAHYQRIDEDQLAAKTDGFFTD
ncbi:MAG: insulinase family protein [Pseudomonadales bacterium]